PRRRSGSRGRTPARARRGGRAARRPAGRSQRRWPWGGGAPGRRDGTIGRSFSNQEYERSCYIPPVATGQQQRPVRRQRADGARSRNTILAAAARLATVEGLEGLSIGRLADHIGMSKSGLYAHFGSKEELQLATVETAAVIFREE